MLICAINCGLSLFMALFHFGYLNRIDSFTIDRGEIQVES